jgi:UDP-glucuronate 4-epimerase
MKVLVTGAAGFIGSALSLRLLARGDEVIGIDNLNDYYDVSLKQARLERTTRFDAFTDLRMDLEDRAAIAGVFEKYRPERVVNLAAQAGVRYSLINPQAYVDTNLTGFANILEGCRHHGIRHLVFASSSSVYGANTKMPLSIHDNVDHPFSLYAASKKANELMAHTYSHLYRLPSTGLRFFTVYGPWGRPDMSYLPETYCGESPLMCSITAITGATSPISMMSSRGSYVSSTGYRNRIPGGAVILRIRPRVRRPTGCTISATTSRSN